MSLHLFMSEHWVSWSLFGTGTRDAGCSDTTEELQQVFFGCACVGVKLARAR